MGAYSNKSGTRGVGVQRKQFDSKSIKNRVYIEGGERNIDRSTYGNDTLLLPKNERITYEGVQYTTDATGSYLERITPLAGEDDSLDVSKFYPKRVGTVTAVEKIDDKQGFYNIIDTTILADLDYSKTIIAGETMTIIFQTGQLAGSDKEFDVKYNHTHKRFEIAPIDKNGLIYPQGNLIPAVGDKYAIFHMRMPESYITNAEQEALQETAKYLWENEQPQYSYRWQLDGIYAKRNWGAIRGFLNCGFFVKFSDPQFLPQPVDVRIVAVKEYVNDPQSPEITIANNVSGRTLGSVINEIPTQEQATDQKDKEVVAYTKRGFRQANETMQKLIDSMLEGFDDAMKPIAVQTMMMLVGDESLQFRYVDNKNIPTAQPSGIVYDKNNKRLVCPVGIMQHMTLGITSISSSHAADEYKFWDTKAYQSAVLTDTKKSYFLYLKCSKTNYSDATYLISEDGIKMDAVSGYYHFLVGILNSEDESANRSFTEMFGFTEITPARILAQLITSHDGSFIIDLAQSLLEIYNKEQKSMIRLDGSDGSGHLAGENLKWDARGNLNVRGHIDGISGKFGNFYFVELASPNAGRMLYESRKGTDEELLIYFSPSYFTLTSTGGRNASIYVKRADVKNALSVGLYVDSDAEVYGQLTVTENPDTNRPAINCKGKIKMKDLPTDPFGLTSGFLWRDNDVLKIVP